MVGTTRVAMSRHERREARTGLMFAAPTALVVGLVFLVPLGLLAWMSLNDWPLLGTPEFVGLQNFAAAARGPLFLDAVWFTLRYTLIVTIVLFVVAFGLALLVQRAGPGVGMLRTAYFLPAVLGLAVTTLMWVAMFNNEVGPLSDVLMALGVVDEPVNWLGTPDNALWSTVLMITWRFAGFQMLILLTGLQAIPSEVYEAARADGASWSRTLWHITLPMMRPTIALLLVLSVTGSLLAFEQFFLLTAGGPDNSTVTVVMTVYREAFVLLDLGVAAAMSLVLLAALVLTNVVQLSVLRRGDR